MRVHLVDATYELFRAYHSPRPPVRGRDEMDLGAVAGLVGTLLAVLRYEKATHVACAHDRVIRSFRNDMYAGYKTEAGVPEDLLAQFPVAEEAIEALGIVLWAETEFEADDALATAAAWCMAEPSVEQVVICTPDKDLAQCVVGSRVVLRDRRREITYDDAAVRAKWGVPPALIADYLGLVGDAADGYPGLPGFGAKGAAAVLSAFGPLEAVRAAPVGSWPSSVRGAARLAATLDEQWSTALLYRDLARLRLHVPMAQRSVGELEWRGAPRAEWEAFCARWGLASLAGRPHRWREE